MVNFDDVFQYVGSYGKYQLMVFLLVIITGIPQGFQTYMNTFTFAVPPHRCRLPSIPHDDFFINASTPEGALVSRLVPIKDDGALDSCRYFNHTGVFPDVTVDNSSTINCTSWVYDHTYFPDNVVTQLNLYCESFTLVELANSMVFVGMLIGSLVFGDISDRFGRHTAISVGIVGILIFGVATALMKSYWSIVLMRTLSMVCSYGVGLAFFVLLLELFGPKARAIIGILIGLAFAMGVSVFGLVASYIRPWRWLQLAGSLPVAIFLIYIFIVPESPRWLLTRGKLIRFKKAIFRAAAVNKRTIPQTFIDDLVKRVLEEAENPKKERLSLLSLFRRPNLAFKTLVLCFCWFVVNMTYYGITMNLTALAGDPFTKVILNGLVEFPSIFLLLILMFFVGRRFITSGSFIIGGIACALCPFFPDPSTVNILAQIGKCSISASFAIIYIFSGELYPTCVRTIGIGVCSFSARLGGIFAATVVGEAMKRQWPELPLGVFGVLSVAAGVIVLALPETRNVTLPETLEDAEAFGRPDCCRRRSKTYKVEKIADSGFDEMKRSLLKGEETDEEKIL